MTGPARRVPALRVLAAAALVAAAWTGLRPVPPSRAFDGLETGVWWQGGQIGQRPPQVPEGGLWVSGTPAAHNAISAIRFRMAEHEANPLVTLKVASESDTPEPGVAACPARSSWTAGTAPQSWIERPAYDCSSQRVLGQRSLDGTTILFDLGSFSGPFVDVVLVPNPGAGAVPGVVPPAPIPGNPPSPDPAYDVVFEPPSPASINVHSGLEGEEPFVESGPSDLPAYDPGFAFEPTTPAFAPPVTPPASEPKRSPPAVGGSVRPISPVSQQTPGRSDRVVAAIVFCLLALWWYRLSYLPSGGARPVRLTLHDDPRYVPQPAPALAAPRQGRVPSLR